MIEIIREEDWDSTTEKKTLPKDIKQIGRPDIGDRIYVENQVYQLLHPYDSPGEKTAYVLLGRFENYAGKQCTFVEASIQLKEISFDGGLPQWNDQTWAYIYKQLKHEYDSMVIVGWAMDLRGGMPNTTAHMESLHQTNFGGTHQILFLMDTLEKEEAFYGRKNGRLYRREGFYIYYDKTIPQRMNHAMETLDEEMQPLAGKEERFDKTAVFSGLEASELKDSIQEAPVPEDVIIWEAARKKEQTSKEEITFEEMSEKEPESTDRSEKKRGSYRQQVVKQEGKQTIPAYSSSLVLAVVVCVLGFAAYQNYQKMNSMEETLSQMNQVPSVHETEQAQNTEASVVKIESVMGNINKQEEPAAATEMPITDSQAELDQNTENQAPPESSVPAPEQDGAPADQTAETGNAENTPAAAETVPTEAQTYLNQGYYIVQKGDNLAGICRKIYQTTVMMDKLCEVNGIENPDSIYAGQYLTLPN